MTSVWTGRSGPAPGTRGAGGPRAVWSVAASLSGSVLGAGMLLMPSVVRGVAGPFSLWAWVAHLALGASVALLLARTVVARRPERLSDTVSGLLRPAAGRLVDIVYAVAFTFGQAAIAWFAAVCVLAVFPVPLPARGAVGALLACGVLVVALSLASVGPAPGAGMSRARRWPTGLVALMRLHRPAGVRCRIGPVGVRRTVLLGVLAGAGGSLLRRRRVGVGHGECARPAPRAPARRRGGPPRSGDRHRRSSDPGRRLPVRRGSVVGRGRTRRRPVHARRPGPRPGGLLLFDEHQDRGRHHLQGAVHGELPRRGPGLAGRPGLYGLGLAGRP